MKKFIQYSHKKTIRSIQKLKLPKQSTPNNWALFILLSHLLSLGLSTPAQSAIPLVAPLNIFGRDDRSLRVSLPPELTAIGRLMRGGAYCTATVVGRRLLLTAAHCVVDRETRTPYPLSELSFVAGAGTTAQRPAVGIVASEVGGTHTDVNRAWDWALLTLAENLGDQTGWIPLRAASPRELTQLQSGLTLVGYSRDLADGNVPSTHYGCSIHSVSRGVIEHDCDMTPGASGGPILTGLLPNGARAKSTVEIVGINVAELHPTHFVPFRMVRDQVPPGAPYSSRTSNLGVSVANFIRSAQALLQ
jgi:protease YdgD